MGSREEWDVVEPLEGGGQSDVYLVRTPKRCSERTKSLEQLRFTANNAAKRGGLARAIWSYARPDLPSELGALKLFKIPAEYPKSLLPPPESEEGVAIERLKNEIAVLNQSRPVLPKLLDSNVAQRWIVTEFFPERTLERSPFRFKGKAALAMQAFRSLVQTVARCIKKATSIGILNQRMPSSERTMSLCLPILGSTMGQTHRSE